MTASGRRLFVLDPDPEEIIIEDIAHALSQICRFGGMSTDFYSVAQHSVMVSRIVPPTFALLGLLHDASEAFLGDVIRPLKMLLPEYSRIEQRWEEVILDKFWLRNTENASVEVKAADRIALATERRDLVAPHSWRWDLDEQGYQPLPERIVPLPPIEARRLFLDRCEELTHG